MSFFANVSLDSDEVRRSTGRLFQVAGPNTAKSLRPIMVRVHGTTSALLFADHSCHLPMTDETGVHTSAKYDGALPCLSVCAWWTSTDAWWSLVILSSVCQFVPCHVVHQWCQSLMLHSQLLHHHCLSITGRSLPLTHAVNSSRPELIMHQ